MLRGLALMSLALTLTCGMLVAVLFSRRVTLARRDHRSAEQRLTPLALLVTFEDAETPALDSRDAAILAALLSHFSARLQGDARERISEYLVLHGHVCAEVEKLSDPRPWYRASAAYVLGDMGSVTATTGLLRALQDPSRDVRAAAARSLGQLRDPQSVQPLVCALVAHTVPRRVIGQALLTVGPGAAQQLLPLLNDPDPDVRATAAQLIGLLDDGGAQRLLIGRLEDSSSGVREHAALALGRLGTALACHSLMRMLADSAPCVRAAAAQALGAIGDPRAFTALLAVADGDSFAPARAAAHALSRIDSVRLAQVARDPAASVHLMAARDTAALAHAAP